MDMPVSSPAFDVHRLVRALVGAFFIAVGVILTLDNFDLLDAGDYLRWWPALLVVTGLIKAVAERPVAGGILVLAGAVLLAVNAGWLRFSLFDLWPLLLVAIGLAILARGLGLTWRPPAIDSPSTVWAVLSERKVTGTRDFTGANIVALLGSCRLDLTQSEIRRTPAVIVATAICAGVEITVPDGWEIVGEVVPVMGAFEIHTRAASNPSQQLVVRGLALMGGIEIRSRRTE